MVSRLRPDSITPLGWPVVPPVPAIIARSSTAGTSIGASLAPSSHCASDGANAHGWSMQTNTRTLGSPARICSTIGA